MLATLIAGRLTNRVDPRLQMFLGILVICYSMWRMIDWTPDVDEWSLHPTTFVQGSWLEQWRCARRRSAGRQRRSL